MSSCTNHSRVCVLSARNCIRYQKCRPIIEDCAFFAKFCEILSVQPYGMWLTFWVVLNLKSLARIESQSEIRTHAGSLGVGGSHSFTRFTVGSAWPKPELCHLTSEMTPLDFQNAISNYTIQEHVL
jgi:hypothetical protein